MGCKNWWDQTAWDYYLELWSLFLSVKLNAISAPAGRCRAIATAKVAPSLHPSLFKTVFSTQTFQYRLFNTDFAAAVFQPRFFNLGARQPVFTTGFAPAPIPTAEYDSGSRAPRAMFATAGYR